MRTEQFSLPLATSTQVFDTLVRVIRYDEGSGTGTPKIRIKSLSGGAFDVEMVPGRQIKLPEIVRGLHISNLTGSAITGKITIGSGDISDNSLVGTVTLDAATLAALETISLDAPTIASLAQPIEPSGFYSSTSTLTANQTDPVFLPAENTKGAIVLSASFSDVVNTTSNACFIAKASAPTSVLDGEVVCGSIATYSANTNPTTINGRLEKPQFIAAGKGLYFISQSTTNGFMRACRYKLL